LEFGEHVSRRKRVLQRTYGETDFLTGVRAIAILFVFLLHSGGGGLRELGEIGDFIVDCGKYGITIFFVISGYTIFSQFFKEEYTLKKFILVRLARISLPYYPIILLVFIYIALGGMQFNGWAERFNNGRIDLANLLAHLTYIAPYDIHWQNTIIGVEWTLGIEVFFYFALGTLIHFNVVRVSRDSLIYLGVFSLAISILTLLTRTWLNLDPLFVYWLPFRYCYLFYLGGLSFVLREKYLEYSSTEDARARLTSDAVQVLLVIGFAISALVPTIRQSLGIVVEFGFGFATLALVVLYRGAGRMSGLLKSRPLVLLGSMSYSLYLIHYIVILTLRVSGGVFLEFVVWLVVSVAISFLWYYLFERAVYTRVKTLIKRLR
jgi:peptidoglycan/LPS O-acetylase OafA/YrhL